MKFGASLRVVAAVFLWVNVAHACGTASHSAATINFDEIETLAAVVAEVTASIPDRSWDDALLESAWRRGVLLDHEGDDELATAEAANEVHAAVLAFLAEAVPSLELAVDGLEDR